MDAVTVADVIIVTLTLITTLSLLVVSRFEHKYSVLFFNIIIVGSIHAIFCCLVFLRTYWYRPNGVLFEDNSDATYTFSMICFAACYIIIMAVVNFEQQSHNVCFVLFEFVSLILIVGIKIILNSRMLIRETVGSKSENVLPFITDLNLKFMPQNHSSVTILDVVDSIRTGLFLEYLFIYIPATVLFYKKLHRTSTTLTEWWDLPSKEECGGCQFNLSLTNHLAVYFFIVIWCLRPLYFISYKQFIFSLENNDCIPMVAMVTVYIVSLVYILKIRVVGNFKKCTRPEFLKESHLDKNDVEI